jgi:hypothetical protein
MTVFLFINKWYAAIFLLSLIVYKENNKWNAIYFQIKT